MNLAQYQIEAQNTKSPQFYGEIVARSVFANRMSDAIRTLRKLDEVKKALFYKRENGELEPGENETTCMALQIHNIANEPQNGIDLVHAVLGIATEAGELLEALYASLVVGQNKDNVNVFEEFGDVMWYLAIAFTAMQSSFEHCASVNNAKLRKRFANKFTEFDANNRDLKGEREVLEGGTSTVLNGMLEDASREESSGDMLQRLGTDGDKWAREFVNRLEHMDFSADDTKEASIDTIRAWFANAIEAGKQSQISESEVRQFIGWLSGDIRELNNVQIPILADSWQRFRKRYQTGEKVEATLYEGAGTIVDHQIGKAIDKGEALTHLVFPVDIYKANGFSPDKTYTVEYYGRMFTGVRFVSQEAEPKTEEMFPVVPREHHANKEQCPYCRSRDPKPKPDSGIAKEHFAAD